MAKLKAENLRTDWCKGCGYCVDVCPQKALSVGKALNDQGYLFVELREDACVACGVCRIVCPDSVFVFTEQ